MVPRIWGVPPPPAAGDPTRGVTTVRNLGSPFWIGNLRNSEFRCLVPVTSFSEWGNTIDVEGRRERHHFTCTDAPIFAFAGVWKDSEIPTFAILTCKANATLRAIGKDTMPVVLSNTRTAQDQWLYGGWDTAQRLVQPCPDDWLTASAVRSG